MVEQQSEDLPFNITQFLYALDSLVTVSYETLVTTPWKVDLSSSEEERRIVPEKTELEFEYSDPSIHKDVHAMLDLCTTIAFKDSPGPKGRTMKFWEMIEERFLAGDDEGDSFPSAMAEGEKTTIQSGQVKRRRYVDVHKAVPMESEEWHDCISEVTFLGFASFILSMLNFFFPILGNSSCSRGR